MQRIWKNYLNWYIERPINRRFAIGKISEDKKEERRPSNMVMLSKE